MATNAPCLLAPPVRLRAFDWKGAEGLKTRIPSRSAFRLSAILIVMVTIFSVSRSMAQTAARATKAGLDQVVLENFVLENAPLVEALQKWKNEVTLVTGGSPSMFFNGEQINNPSSRIGPYGNTPINLKFHYVLAGECLRRIIDQANIRAKEAHFTLMWLNENAFGINAGASPRGLKTVREVTFKEFKVSDDSLLGLIKEWRDAVKRYGEPGKNEVYYQAFEISEFHKIPQRIQLNLVNVPALEALDAICRLAPASVKWGSFSSGNERWDFQVSHHAGSGSDVLLEWKNKENKVIKAAFVSLGPLSVTLRPSVGRIVEYPLENLSSESLIQALSQGRSSFE